MYTYDSAYYIDANGEIHKEDLGNDYTVSEDNGQIMITYNNKGIGDIYLVFKLQRDADNRVKIGEAQTNAEIIEYTTKEGGYIDKDSQPGNCAIEEKHEDDCQEAQVTFTVEKDNREISGTVAEANADGTLKTDKTIDDVIVQLIEIVHGNDNKDYEYIWQETVSGHNIVKARDKDGKACTYKNDVEQGSGQYKFLGFSETVADSYNENGVNYTYGGTIIPGDYIVRFIYGDGVGRIYEVKYDLTKNPPERNLNPITLNNTEKQKVMYDANNIYKYNGQDYKSAVDPNYHEEWYDATKYGANTSKARDNEARRLEVMSYATNVDKATWENLHDDVNVLDNSWMCAETSKIDINKAVDETKEQTVNFGLVLRPKTKISLEKHITALSIKPNNAGANEAVNAKIANIVDLINAADGDEIETTGTNNHLQAMKSEWWYVQEDVEELMQGAALEVEYTYVVKNQSDIDYLSKTLENMYENDTEHYSDNLKALAHNNDNVAKLKGHTNAYGDLLGQFYYTGNVNTDTDAVTKVRVNTVYDYINNKLEFRQEENNDFIKVTDASVDTEGNIIVDDPSTSGVKKEDLKVNTVIKNKEEFAYIRPKDSGETWNVDNADYTKKVKLRATLSGSSSEIEINPYVVEIVEYSTPIGRVDMEACPNNAADDDRILAANTQVEWETSSISGIRTGTTGILEHDEYLSAGRIIISKPTGEDKTTSLQITIVAIASVAVVGVGIILIKKYVLTKKA